MRRLRAFLARAAALFDGARRDLDFQQELATHLEMQVEENLRTGMAPDAARRSAVLKLGGFEAARELHREHRGLPLLEALGQDVHLGLRMMRRSHGFTAVALIVLGVGIGANTLMFSVVNTLLLRPLPYPEAARLQLVRTVGSAHQEPLATAVPDFMEYRSRNRTFEGLASFYLRPYDLTGGEEPERIRTLIVSSEFLRVLRTLPRLGRDLARSDERWGDHGVVILTEGFWRRRFAGNPTVLGQRINLNSEPYTVVGILPPAFSFVGIDAQAVVPMSFAPGDNLNSHNNYFLTMVGRLSPGLEAAAASEDLNLISSSIAAEHPENKGTEIAVHDLQQAVVGDMKPALFVLGGAVGFVLLIACANLAGLLLARSGGRRREIALRMAIGASRGRILRQLLTESVLLSFGGGLVAVGLARMGLRLVNSLSQTLLPRTEDVRIDTAVLAVTVFLAVLTGTLFGLTPALRSVDLDLGAELKDGTRAGGDRRAHRLRSALVIAEVAMSLVLLIGAGLMMASIRSLIRVDAGFDARSVLTVQLNIPKRRYVDEDLERRFSNRAYAKASRFFAAVIDEMRSAPGVRAAGAINGLPLMGEVWGKYATLYDRPLPASLRELPEIQYRVVAGDYFRALDIPILRGRAFTDADTEESPKVAIVNRQMAHLYWKGQDPIGKVISVNPPRDLTPPGTVPPDYSPTLFTVVGVAADVRYGALETRPATLVYTPFAQGSEGTTTMYLAIRTDGNPAPLAEVVRGRIKQVDPDVPASNIQTMEARVASSVGRPRLHAIVLGTFALLALALSALGIYGVMSEAAAERTREIGIRMAVGATARSIRTLFLRQGLALVVAGALMGLAGAAALTRVLRSLLFEVSPTDPTVFVTITAVLLAVGGLAAWLPARRATRLDPLAVLREP